MSHLDGFQTLLNRYRSVSPAMKDGILPTLKARADAVAGEMTELETVMSSKRDWLDTHRDDPRYEKRKARFMDTEVKRHAEYGEVLEQYGQIIGQRAFLTSDVRASYDDPNGPRTPVDCGEIAPDRIPGRTNSPDDPVARSKPVGPEMGQTRIGSLANRLRAERAGG